MIDRRRQPLLTSALAFALSATSFAYVADVPVEIGVAVALAHAAVFFFTLDVFRDYTFGFPAGFFSCLSLLLWGPGSIPWALAGTLVAFTVQFGLWTRFGYQPSARFRLAAESHASARSLGAFVFEGMRFAADWYAVMMLAYVPYRMAGGKIPVDTASWQQVWLAIVLLTATNVLWLVTAEIRASELRSRLDDTAPRSLSLFAWALFGVYLPLPGTVLVLFAIDQYHDHGVAALFLWTAASVPFHFGMKALLAASTAHFEAERERDRQRQLAMIAAQASTILHEAVHQIGLLSLLLSTPKEGTVPVKLDDARRVLGDLERTIEHFRVSLRRHEAERTVVDLRSLVEEAGRTAAGDDARALHWRIDTAAGSYTALGHAFLLHSALANVMRNAIEASPAGSSAELELARRGNTARIVVRDHGAGIAAEDRERVFDPAYSRKGSRGLGLGLYLAREVVRVHGGSIVTSSPPEGGTCFTIILPLLESRT